MEFCREMMLLVAALPIWLELTVTSRDTYGHERDEADATTPGLADPIPRITSQH